MALASLFSGLALANAGLGSSAWLCGSHWGKFNAPHGAVCAALLPEVMEVNILALRQRRPDSKALVRYAEAAAIVDRLATSQPGGRRHPGCVSFGGVWQFPA
jgi:alcohol dehydrogenase class IV